MTHHTAYLISCFPWSLTTIHSLITSCCPSYTIRLDVTKYQQSKSHKKVLKNLHKFLFRHDGQAEEDHEAQEIDTSTAPEHGQDGHIRAGPSVKGPKSKAVGKGGHGSMEHTNAEEHQHDDGAS